MTDKEIIKALECCGKNPPACHECKYKGKCNRIDCYDYLKRDALDLINRQQAEIERLKNEVSVSRRKALLEASEKFAGHSDYHGDTILGKLICMAEGKEVGEARPLDKNEIKTEAIKEFWSRLQGIAYQSGDWSHGEHPMVVELDDAEEIYEEMVGEQE